MKKQVNDTRDQNTDIPSSLFLHDIVEVGFHVSVIIVTSSVTIGADIETQKPSSVRSKKKISKKNVMKESLKQYLNICLIMLNALASSDINAGFFFFKGLRSSCMSRCGGLLAAGLLIICGKLFHKLVVPTLIFVFA